MNYYKRHLGDYARDTGHLTALEHGIYTLLLDWYYTNERPIPTEKAIRIARGNPSETESVLREFFVWSDEGWRHHYADREIASYHARAETNRATGKLGGRPRKTESVSKRNPDVTLATSHKPLTTTEAKATVEPAVRLPDRFPEFWSAYPNKQGKQEAWKRWKRDKLDAIADTILSHVARMRAEDDGWQRGYAPMGSTYLNQARWTDEPRAAPVAANHQPSKTMGGLLALEAMKRGNGLAQNGSNHRAAEAALPILGTHASGRDANGHGDCVDGEFVEVVVASGARHAEDS